MLSPLSPSLPTRTGERFFWGNLSTATEALAFANAALAHQGLTLVVTSDSANALRLEEEIKFFAERLSVLSVRSQALVKSARSFISN